MKPRRRLLIMILFLVTLVVAGAAVYVGSTIQNADLSPQKTSAAVDFGTNYGPCSGNCNSGQECNGYGDPPPGTMFSCWENNGSYGCYAETTNAGGSQCFLSCGSGWQACGCDVAACEQKCRDANAGNTGTFNFTDICTTCQQKFTCSCTLSTTPTPTPTTNTPTPTPSTTTPTPTVTTTPTPTLSVTPSVTETPTPTPSFVTEETPTPTPTTTTTLPETALVSDEVDAILVGIVALTLGVWMYLTGVHYYLGNLIGKAAFTLRLTEEVRVEKSRESFEKEFSKDDN